MPHSLVLNLLPQSPIYPNFLTGRHYHALFLNLISSVDRTLGDKLHASNSDKAFTLSPLQVQTNVKSFPLPTLRSQNPTKVQQQNPVKRSLVNTAQSPSGGCLQISQSEPIPEGTPCWWRISLLDDALFAKLTPLWLNINPEHSWHLGSANLFVTSIFATPQSTQPWANACTYSQLYEQASDTYRLMNFHFATPVAFRQGVFDNALPSKESVFNSLLSRWNKYSGIEFNDIPMDAIYPSHFNINTESINNYDNKFIGCVGEMSYRIFGDIEAIAIKQINALADFALYSGIGRKTTMGMGMARRVRNFDF
ncbi:MAG: CRISPR-associated endoribonuclease Cas6 [Scytonematopsis contorta HA4267-MV1]|jgi:CRISPR-associated endoribonuclease Cas6|nr:CRISPR-associated endoribonuclease Cas6 [Scytonematopsis contorta HA4267-MV1]